jgi:hypothetical protein
MGAKKIFSRVSIFLLKLLPSYANKAASHVSIRPQQEAISRRDTFTTAGCSTFLAAETTFKFKGKGGKEQLSIHQMVVANNQKKEGYHDKSRINHRDR